LNNKDELLKIKLLIEKANIKYANLTDEFKSRGITTMTLDEYKTFMKKNVDNEILDKIFKILVLRGYIETLDKKVSLTNLNFVNKGIHLDEDDENFARQLLNMYRNYDSV
jgi:hypothetical protein